MNKSNKLIAFLAYFLPIIGWLIVLLFDRKNKFAVFHAWQSFLLTMLLVFSQLLWFVFMWLVTFIPMAGPMLSMFFYSLVIAIMIFGIIGWLVGMVNALTGRWQPLPIIGRSAARVGGYI